MPGIHVAMAIAQGLPLLPWEPPMPSVAVPAVSDHPLCPDAQGREQERGHGAATLSQLLKLWSQGTSRAGSRTIGFNSF